MKNAERVFVRAGVRYWFDEEEQVWKCELSDLVFDDREDVREFIDDIVYYSYFMNN